MSGSFWKFGCICVILQDRTKSGVLSQLKQLISIVMFVYKYPTNLLNLSLHFMGCLSRIPVFDFCTWHVFIQHFADVQSPSTVLDSKQMQNCVKIKINAPIVKGVKHTQVLVIATPHKPSCF